MSEPKIPQALEAESGILSCCFIDPESFPALLDSALEAGHFMDPRHQIIFQALSSIYERSEPMEELTISRELERAGSLRQVGGMEMLMSLAGRVETTAYLSEWIRMVKDAHVRREVMRKARSLIEDARENTEDPGVWIEKVEQEVYQIGDWARVGCHVSTGSQIVMAGDAAQMGVDAIIRQIEGKSSGVPSGFREMDNLTGGLCSPALIILAARPSVGKTAVALQISDNIATNQGHPVLFFSLEMSVEQLMTRAISRRASINVMRARDRILSDTQRRRMDSAAEQISGGGLMIDDSGNLHVNQIRARCRRIKARRGLGLVVIDYLQLVAGDGGDRRKREEQVAFISRELKGMAKELDVPVLVLAQFNREAVKNGQRPALHNLRESGAIEQDADVAILMSADNPEEDARASERKILFDLAKQRNGPVGYWKLIFETNFQRFREEGMEVAGEEEAARPAASSWHKDPTPPEREPASVFSNEPEEEEEPLF